MPFSVRSRTSAGTYC